MSKLATLTGHTYRVLYLAISPDGQTIVTGAGDETLRFWNVFPSPKSQNTDPVTFDLHSRLVDTSSTAMLPLPNKKMTGAEKAANAGEKRNKPFTDGLVQIGRQNMGRKKAGKIRAIEINLRNLFFGPLCKKCDRRFAVEYSFFFKTLLLDLVPYDLFLFLGGNNDLDKAEGHLLMSLPVAQTFSDTGVFVMTFALFCWPTPYRCYCRYAVDVDIPFSNSDLAVGTSALGTRLSSHGCTFTCEESRTPEESPFLVVAALQSPLALDVNSLFLTPSSIGTVLQTNQYLQSLSSIISQSRRHQRATTAEELSLAALYHAPPLQISVFFISLAAMAFHRSAFSPNNSNWTDSSPSTTYLGDRFIPVRSAMDFDVAHFLLTSGKKKKDIDTLASPSKEYRKQLASIMLKDHNNLDEYRILKFNAQPKKRELNSLLATAEDLFPVAKRRQGLRRHIPQQTAERTLDAPDLVDDYYLNLLDWSCKNVLAIGLGNIVYLWNATNQVTVELTEVREDDGPITSISWAPDGTKVAVGLNNSEVQIWDSLSLKQVRSLMGHSTRVGSLSWNGSILSTGGQDSKIFNHDEVCGLKWSLSGKQLASGGNDNLLYIWDVGLHSDRYLHRLDAHKAAVRALAWCPYQSNLLASGGGTADRCIKLWNTQNGAILNSIDTNSQVCSLQWNRHEKEILSSHGFSENQLTLWKFPSMKKITEITGHTARVLHLALSPDGFTVASAAADETLRFWQIFGNPTSPGVSRKGIKKESAFPLSEKGSPPTNLEPRIRPHLGELFNGA
ncbi:hypothetical protein ACLOJK_032273 [Asimina triloba]